MKLKYEIHSPGVYFKLHSKKKKNNLDNNYVWPDFYQQGLLLSLAVCETLLCTSVFEMKS